MKIYEPMRIVSPFDRRETVPERWGVSRFGIIEGITAIVAAVTSAVGAASAAVGGFLATDIGIGSATAGILGDAVVGAGVGGVLGAGESAISGGNVLKGFESGLIGGGVLGAGAPLLEEVGLGVTGADILAGSAGGALGSAATGGNPLTGAATGAAGGALTAAISPTATPSAGAPGGGATSAVGSAAPPSVGAPTADASAVAASTPAGALPSATGSTLPSIDMSADPGVSLSGGATSANLPGSVGTGAASGAATNTTGITSAAPAAPSVTPSASAPTNSWGKFVADPSFSTAGDVLSANPTLSLGVAGLGAEALLNKPPAFSGQLTAEAKNLGSEGAQMTSYLSSGRLPPGLQANVDAAAQSAVASIKSMYAARGMSGSSAEAEDVARVQQTAVTQGANIALQLFNQGLNETQLSNQLYTQLMQVSMSEDSALSAGVGNLVSAMALSSRPLTATPAATGT